MGEEIEVDERKKVGWLILGIKVTYVPFTHSNSPARKREYAWGVELKGKRGDQ
jgi:hypothetical protein